MSKLSMPITIHIWCCNRNDIKINTPTQTRRGRAVSEFIAFTRGVKIEKIVKGSGAQNKSNEDNQTKKYYFPMDKRINWDSAY